MIRSSFARAYLLLCVALTLPTVALAADASGITEADITRIDAIFVPYARADRPGCAVAVSTHGVVRFSKGYGLASVEHGIPNGARTTFNIGSIGKQFTAMAVLLLEQRGALSLDDPVSRYYEGLPTDGPPLRIHDLLYHTSGLRDYSALGMLAGNFAVTDDAFDAMMRRQRGLNFPTGSNHEYSHSDYIVLATIVAHVAGVPFAHFLEKEIFGPLGMTSTRVFDRERRPVPGIATAYEVDGDALRTRYPSSELVGGNNVFSSVEDLLRWEANATSGRVGGKALIARLHGAAPIALPYVMPYAHGLWTATYRGEQLQHRSGGGGGYRTTYLRFPDAGLAVTALCNRTDIHPFPLARSVADGFLTERPAEVDPTKDTVATPIGEAKRLAGRYASVQKPWDPFEFVADGDELFEHYSEGSSKLTRLLDGRYTADGRIYAFTSPTDGAPIHLLLTGDDTREDGVRVPTTPPWIPSEKELAEYAGNWRSDELVVDWAIVIDGDTAMLRRPNANDVALIPRSRDNFRGSVLNGSGYPTSIGVDFKRNQQGRVTSFAVSAFPAAFEVARGVRFARMP